LSGSQRSVHRIASAPFERPLDVITDVTTLRA